MGICPNRAALFHADIRTDERKDRQTDRRTDMTKLIAAFRNFPNAPEMFCRLHID